MLLKDNKSESLELPTFDPLVVLWQFYFAPPDTDSMQFNIATTRKIYHYSFRRDGVETIELPFGDVEAEIWRRETGDGALDARRLARTVAALRRGQGASVELARHRRSCCSTAFASTRLSRSNERRRAAPRREERPLRGQRSGRFGH